MSITLMAYPMAFLIAPEKAKNSKLELSSKNNTAITSRDASKNLRSIKVLTNISYQEIQDYMTRCGCAQINQEVFRHKSGMAIKQANHGKYVNLEIFGINNPKKLQEEGEKFFQALDAVAGRNVRLINSSEYFYYNYDTSYTELKDIYASLKSEGAKEIFTTEKQELIANLNGEGIKYYKIPGDKTYTLEIEQQIKILNIGTNGDFEGRNITYGLTNLSIKTNILPSELKELLYNAKYLYYENTGQTPLKNSDAILNWVIKDGYYTAEFSGSNNAAITKEAEIIFRKLNKAAGRDLRIVNDISTTVYTYTTNYTDKGVLLNTLYEHGAEEIRENSEEISCKMFGMEMVYYKKPGINGYTLDITQVSDKDKCMDVINDLNDEYGLNIQEMTYNKIKERLQNEDFRLESETVMEDNSIVLTIEV